jgi:hypothetical protein
MPNAIRSVDPWAIASARLPDDYTDPAAALPDNLTRGDENHLAFLTLAYTLSGGREPESFWSAARLTYAADPELFALRGQKGGVRLQNLAFQNGQRQRRVFLQPV